MLRLLMALQVVQVCLATSTLLPMELYEIAHSHQGTQTEAVSLHDLLVAEDHFQERTHPLARITEPLSLGHVPQLAQRRHRKAATSGSRRRSRTQQQQHSRQGRQMVSHESSSVASEPKIYYAMGVSKHVNHCCYYYYCWDRMQCKYGLRWGPIALRIEIECVGGYDDDYDVAQVTSC